MEEPRPHPQAQHRCQEIGWGVPSGGKLVGANIRSRPVVAGVVSLSTKTRECRGYRFA